MGKFSALIEQPNDVQFESQQNDEKLHFLLRRHPITNLGWIIAAIIFAVLPIIAMLLVENNFDNPFAYVPAKYQLVFIILWYLVTMLYTFESFIVWYFNVYIITDKRLIDVDFKGLWGKRISEALLDSVEDVSYETHQFWHILFDYGDIFMQTAAEKTEFEFHSIPKPGIVHDKLTDLVQLYKAKNGNSN